MKKTLILFCAGVLMSALCVGFVACNEPKDSEQNEEGTEIQPVSVSEVNAELATFLDDNDGMIMGSLFDEGKLITGKDSCVMINSEDELPGTDYIDNTEYPAIDFDAYTLVIGGCFKGDTAWNIAQQSIVVGPKEITMYIQAERPEDMGGFAIPSIIPFWGLYPKLPNLPISVVCK